MDTVRGIPRPAASVHRVCGQVSSFRPDVFTFRPDVSTFPANLPQKCPLGPRMCSPSPLTGIRDGPVCPAGEGRSGSDFGGRAALGTRRATARGPGRRPTLSDLPFRDLCVTRGGLPGRPSPQPSPTGRGGKSGRAFKNAGRLAKVSLQRERRRGAVVLDDRRGRRAWGYWRPPRGTSRSSSRSRRSNWRVRSVRWDWPMSAMNCQ